MNCTSCRKGILEANLIEGQLSANTCSSCGGNWILIEDFVAWKERNPNYDFTENMCIEPESFDTKKALLCPVSGSIMRKFLISANNEHRVDYSAAVGGLWLDKGEWEIIKTEGLAGSLNAIVTQQWQHQIRTQSAKQNFSDIYQDKFGDEAYTKIKAFREWLIKHPQKADLSAYLLAEDPYSAER